jgi:hypothetical protein
MPKDMNLHFVQVPPAGVFVAKKTEGATAPGATRPVRAC